MIAADGGEIELMTADAERVVLRLSGSCKGCPGRPYTVARMIEPVLRRELGEAIAIAFEGG